MSVAHVDVIKASAVAKLFSTDMHTVSDTIFCQGRTPLNALSTLTVSKPDTRNLCSWRGSKFWEELSTLAFLST